MRRSGAGGIASRTMGSGVHVKQQGTENNDRRFYFPNNQQYVRQQHQLLQPHQPQRYAHRQLQQQHQPHQHQYVRQQHQLLQPHQPQRYAHRQLQHQPHQHQYVRQQQQLLPPHRSSHHASPKWGIGGPFDCGSNATGWYQEESPPPPNTPMGGVYQCKRCGRLGHMAQICTTPQRFEGTCNSCGQYGHRHHNCITNTNNKQQQSQMVMADVNFFRVLQGQWAGRWALRCMWDCRDRKTTMVDLFLSCLDLRSRRRKTTMVDLFLRCSDLRS